MSTQDSPTLNSDDRRRIARALADYINHCEYMAKSRTNQDDREYWVVEKNEASELSERIQPGEQEDQTQNLTPIVNGKCPHGFDICYPSCSPKGCVHTTVVEQERKKQQDSVPEES
jgi:hypothetical protein